METSSKKIIVQKFLRNVGDDYAMAEKYYSMLSTINDLKLTTREIQLVAFTAIRGNISYSSIREDFCKKYNSTSPTINNIISKLKRIGVFVKDGTKIKVNPVILLPFTENITLELKMEHNGRPMTDKELLIRTIASKLLFAEKTIEAVINHQFASANSAMDTNKSVEISGFGKFMFNEKKAARRLKTYLMKKHDMHTIINHPTSTSEQIRKATLIYNDMVDNIALLKPNISDEFLRDLRGMEEQVDSPLQDEGDD